MWARAEGIRTILTNAAGSCVARLCYFCGSAECMYSIVAIGEGGMLMSRSFKVDGIQMPLWEVG
jgi:hypothetical protein